MNEPRPIESFLEGWRLRVVSGLVLVLFLFYAFRLFSLQILDGESYRDQATENRTTRISDPAPRGIIYDRNGVVLAQNVPSYNVVVTPAYLPGTLPFTQEESIPGEIQEVYRELSKILRMPVSNGYVDENTVFTPCDTDLGIKQIVYIGDTTSPYDPVRIRCNVSDETARTIRERAADLRGVTIEVEAVRDYPTGAITAEIIGFLGPIPENQEAYYREKGFVPGRDKVGYAGVENSLQDILGGNNGERYVEVDVAGLELRNLAEPIDPIPGNNIRLTIDVRLQLAARESLITWMDWYNSVKGEEVMNSGAVVAIDPRTGEVLALVSYPNYENNRMARVIPSYYYQQLVEDPRTPLLNSAISAELPPGSVFKMPTAIGALNERVVAPEDELDDPGIIYIEERPLPNSPVTRVMEYHCWEDEVGHGQVDWLRGVEQSCDVYFYKIGGGFGDQVPDGLGIWRLGEYARALGYGQVTGIELPGEADGLIPDPDWKRIYQGQTWTIGDTYIASMGQSFILSTPLQVVVSAAILANDGKYMRPTLVHDILDSEGNIVKPFEPELKWDITKDPLIQEYDENDIATKNMKTVEPWVVELAQQAMRLVVSQGTAEVPFEDYEDRGILTAGKTGTAEYCDDVAWAKGLCERGTWPAHAWYFGYAPYDEPEIAVVAFVYNGQEGALISAPIVAETIETYYELRAIDADKGGVETAP